MAARHFWVGIDEAGYGPNLGPLVVTAIVARGGARPPDVWKDLPHVRRASDWEPVALCVDDSKRVMQRRDSLLRMLETFFAVVDAVCPHGRRSNRAEIRDERLVRSFGPDVFGGAEIARWSDDQASGLQWIDPRAESIDRPRFVCRRWRVVAARTEVIGPRRFNAMLDRTSNKSEINGQSFLDLIAWLRSIVPVGAVVHVTTDRHGGRHFYSALLSEAFPGHWITKVSETPSVSRYRIEDGSTRYEIEFVVKADDSNGLVAVASMISKLMRERWMERFNAWFARRVPGVRPTAGYPVDAKRFLDEIDGFCQNNDLSREDFWRRK
jgi:ribonuclease HII